MTKAFLELALREEIITFGDFVLKSGKKSPYFFNLGQINNGESLWKLAHFYMEIIIKHHLIFDVLFGPAYKGISLVTSVAMLLSQKLKKPIPFAYNRKEIKSHGEGGQLIGASLENKKVLILDDVITAGTAIKQTISLLNSERAQLSGIVVALDRQERSSQTDSQSIVNKLQKKYHVPIKMIASLSDLIEYTKGNADCNDIHDPLSKYYQQYGASL